MYDEIIYDIWFSALEKISLRKKNLLINQFLSSKNIYNYLFNKNSFINSNINQKIIEYLDKITVSKDLSFANLIYKKAVKNKINIVSYTSKNYPSKLRNLEDAPILLFFRGSLPKEEEVCVGIVGARSCSEYGSYVSYNIAKDLARYKISTISGLAVGIDTYAHRGTNDMNEKTYAVLGCGVDICYPSVNINLYNKIPLNGGIISEFFPQTTPKPYNFPMRNRIIAGLCDILIVVEAKEKSGSLITADMALEMGKEIYVVPGRITDPLSVGCNSLINQGANIYQGINSILENVNISLKNEESSTKEVGIKGEILKFLTESKKDIEEIIHTLKYSEEEIYLTILELIRENKVKEISQNIYAKF